MRITTLLVGILCLATSWSIQAQDRLSKVSQIQFDKQERKVVTSEQVQTFAFKNEMNHVLLPIDNVMTISQTNEKIDVIDLVVKGRNSRGEIVYPVIVSQGMELIKHKQGRFILPVHLASNSSLLFADPIVSFEIKIGSKRQQDSQIVFGDVSILKDNIQSRSQNWDICNVAHIAILLDDSRSNEDDIDLLLEKIENEFEGNTDLDKITISSLNSSGSFFTANVEDQHLWKKQLQSFSQFKKSKYTEWSNGFENVRIVNQKDPIDYVIVVADGFSNRKNGHSINLSNAVELLNEEIERLGSIDNIELEFIHLDESNVLSRYLSDVTAFDNIILRASVEEVKFNIQDLKKDCELKELATKIQISPNPTTDQLFITGLEELDTQGIQIIVRDAQGKVLETKQISDSKDALIRLGKYVDGLYFVEISVDKQVVKTQKIVKVN